jgi:hypothetical protein
MRTISTKCEFLEWYLQKLLSSEPQTKVKARDRLSYTVKIARAYSIVQIDLLDDTKRLFLEEYDRKPIQCAAKFLEFINAVWEEARLIPARDEAADYFVRLTSEVLPLNCLYVEEDRGSNFRYVMSTDQLADDEGVRVHVLLGAIT